MRFRQRNGAAGVNDAETGWRGVKTGRGISVIAKAACAAVLLLAMLPAMVSGVSDGLGRGIELFRAGDHDAALAELRTAIEGADRAPLAYYYAARIRYARGQYSRARGNLIAALEDSAGFTDAMGLLACAHLKMGKTEAALENWEKFVAAAGGAVSEDPVAVESIMTPEDYRARPVRAEKKAGNDYRAPAAPVKPGTAAATATSAKPETAAVQGANPSGKYREAMAVIELTKRHLVQKTTELAFYRSWMGGMINLLLGLVALFTVYAFVKLGKPVEEEDEYAEPASRRWTATPAPPPEPERGYRVTSGRSVSSNERKPYGERPEEKPVTAEALRDIRHRHADEVNRLLKRL